MYYLYKAGQLIAQRLPLKVVYALATGVATLYYWLSHKDRNTLTKNLKVVLDNTTSRGKVDAYTRRAFINFAKYLADFFRFSKLNKAYINKFVKIEGKQYLDKALEKGKGIILLSSHIGNWELGAAVLAKLGYKVHAVTLDHPDKRSTKLFEKQRKTCGVHVISIGPALKQCFKALKKNELVAILGDRDFTNNGESISFFGRDALVPKGAASFSLRTGAPIVPCFVIREKSDRFRYVFERPILPPAKGTQNAIRGLMNTSIKIIEQYIKRHPDQWYVFGKVWD